MGTFGQRLRELRNQRGISQNELSKYVGVSKSSINMYERDEREPGFETLEAIADFFNVNMDFLLGRESNRLFLDGRFDGFSEVDQHRILAELKRMETAGEKTGIVKTENGTLFLFSFLPDQQEPSDLE